MALIHAHSLTLFGQRVFNYRAMQDQTQSVFQVAKLINMLPVKRVTVTSPLPFEPVCLGIFWLWMSEQGGVERFGGEGSALIC